MKQHTPRLLLVTLAMLSYTACGGEPDEVVVIDTPRTESPANDAVLGTDESPDGPGGSDIDEGSPEPSSDEDDPHIDPEQGEEDGVDPDEAPDNPDENPDGGENPDSGANPVISTPYDGTITLEHDWGPNFEGAADLAVADAGVLVIEASDPDQVDWSDVGVEICEAGTDDCRSRWVREPEYDWQPIRIVHRVEPGQKTIVLSYYDTEISADTVDIDVRVDFLPFEQHSSVGTRYDESVPINAPSAHSIVPGTDARAWFVYDAPADGALTVKALDQANDAYACDMAYWGATPARCDSKTQTDVPETTLVDQGEVFILSVPEDDAEPGEFVVFFDPDPAGVSCAAGQHDGGDGTCVAQGDCALGYHDGGWGECVADGACSTGFDVRSDGRCEGWLGVGIIEHFSTFPDIVEWPDGALMPVGFIDDGRPYDYVPSLFDADTDSWNVVTTLVPNTGGFTFCPLSDGRVLTVEYGGFFHTSPLDSESILDPATGSYRLAHNGAGVRWQRPRCILLENGETLVYESRDAMLFDPVTETWSSAGTGPTNASKPNGVEHTPGVVYASVHNSAQATQKSLWRWQRSDNSWTATSDWHHGENLDEDVEVLSVDGRLVLVSPDGKVTEYDPVSDTFIDMAPIPESQVRNVTTDGDVIFWVGADPGLYDPATETWEVLPSASGYPVISDGELMLLSWSPVRYRVAP